MEVVAIVVTVTPGSSCHIKYGIKDVENIKYRILQRVKVELGDGVHVARSVLEKFCDDKCYHL